MAAEILEKDDIEHNEKHDLESIYFVILYLCTMFLGPENQPISKEDIPVFIKFWSELENWKPKLLGFFMSNFLGRRDYQAIIDAMTDYMRDLGDYLRRLHLTLVEENKPNVMHKKWIKILEYCLSSLPSKDVFTPPCPGAIEPIRGRMLDIPRNMDTMKDPKQLLEVVANGQHVGQLVSVDVLPQLDDNDPLFLKLQRMKLAPQESPLAKKSRGGQAQFGGIKQHIKQQCQYGSWIECMSVIDSLLFFW